MSNPFVSTPEDIAKIHNTMSPMKFSVNCIGVEFETEKDFLREVLPPCFDMPDEPTVSVAIGKWRTYTGEHDLSIVNVSCKYNGIAGVKSLAQYLDEVDVPILFGREAWGEGKMRAKSEIYLCGPDLYAFTRHNGTRIIEIEAEITKDIGPFTEENDGFEICAEMDPYASNLRDQPKILHKHFKVNRLVFKEGTGKLTFRGTPFDYLDYIPILKIKRATYSEYQIFSSISSFETLGGNKEDYVPYIFGQKYNKFDGYSTDVKALTRF